MNDDLANDSHPHIAPLLKQYARDLAQITPSSDLDARIDALVAAGPQKSSSRSVRRSSGSSAAVRRTSRSPWQYAASAGIAALAICAGILIGMKLERSRERAAGNLRAAHGVAWGSADLTMWPTDSVSFKIPAEFSAQGTLVAVDPDTKNISTRYWIDVVVSNDGTFRIERIVPADPQPKPGGHDGIAPLVQ